MASEAHHVTQPDAGGDTASRVMSAALRDAEIEPREIGYVSAHGTGTAHNDAMEADAILRVLGPTVPVSSQKAQLGHTLAAAGAIEAAVAILALESGTIPPNANLDDPDPRVGVRLAGPLGVGAALEAVLSNSFGFGGMDAALVFRRGGRSATAPGACEIVITAAVACTGGLACKAVDLGPRAPRRLDRTGRMAASLALDALSTAPHVRRETTGVVTGTAFGAADEASTFFARVLSHGPRLAPPLDFPHMVPSSPAANVSITFGLQGPALSVSEGRLTSLAALATARLVLQEGLATAMLSIGIEVESRVVSHLLTPGSSTPRGSGGALLLLEPEALARAAGVPILARVAFVETWRSGSRLPSVRGPSERAAVIAVEANAPTRELLVALGWADVPLIAIAEHVGSHEAASGAALSMAAARIASGAADRVLVIEVDRGCAGVAQLERA